MLVDNNSSHKWTIREPGQLERTYCTLSGQKYFNTTKYLCTDCAIYRLKNQLEPRWEFEICRDQKFIVLALTLVKIFDFLTFHEVLIY